MATTCSAGMITLASRLGRGFEARSFLTLNDVPLIRDLYAWASIKSADVTFTVRGRGSSAARELIIVGAVVRKAAVLSKRFNELS